MSRFALCLIVWLGTASDAAAQPALPKTLDLERIRSIVVLHSNRWMPLDTLARDVVLEITGNVHYRGRHPVLWLLAWTFDAQTWSEEPLIRISNAELRREIGLPADRKVFSWSELVNHKRLQSLIDGLARVRGRKLDPLEAKVDDIHGRLMTLKSVFESRAIKPVPQPADPLEDWLSVAWVLGNKSPEVEPIRMAWLALKKAFEDDDGAAFSDASDQLAAALATLPAQHRPSAKVIATELRYNDLEPFRLAWMIMALGTFLSLIALFVRRKWMDVLAALAMMAGFGVLTYGLELRWAIAGRIPAANMFESLLFLSWGMGAFAIIAMLFIRHRSVPLTASFMGALALFLAERTGLDGFVRPIAPVLMDTVWMSIHVPIIMVSYSVLFLGVLIAHVQLFVSAFLPAGVRAGEGKLTDSIDRLHYWYIHVGSILLFVGIITGSMWAASSWGRYWGWDPKEVWSLVAFLGYMAIMHVRVSRELVPAWAWGLALALGVAVFAIVLTKLAPLGGMEVIYFAGIAAVMVFFVTSKSKFAVAVKSVLAAWLVIMTYVGVNYVLGMGMHSYGFGTGAIVKYVTLCGVIEVAFVLVCALFHYGRRLARPRLTDGAAAA